MPGYGLDGAWGAFERSAALFEGLVEEMASEIPAVHRGNVAR